MEKKKYTSGFPEIPDVNDVIVGELAERGQWIMANIMTNDVWPVNAQKVTYRGEIIWILPIMKKNFPAVAMKVPAGKTREECEQLLMRFLSNLAWVEQKGFLVDGFSGGCLTAPMGRDKRASCKIVRDWRGR